MTELLAFWIGVTLAAWAVIRIRRAWGAVFEYHGWDWLMVPYFLAWGAWKAVPEPPEARQAPPTGEPEEGP